MILIPLVWEHFVFNITFRSKKVFLVMRYVLQIAEINNLLLLTILWIG